MPDVFAATQEAFVPQMINLEVLGGVSFRKGCFPGQEVVARSQYLGKLRRRMSVAPTTGQATIGAGCSTTPGERRSARSCIAAGAPDGTTSCCSSVRSIAWPGRCTPATARRCASAPCRTSCTT